MDKEEFRIKLEEINHLVENKEYKAAMAVVDSIDWRRVKNVRTLCVVGEIYAANKRYEDSRDIFLLAYHRSSIGKNILYRLIEVSLKMNRFDEATEYYEEFCSVAPNDNTALVLQYKILKAQGSPLDQQIAVLEAYKEKEFTEKWSYELAQLYYRAGEKKKCEDLCNEMILWFSEGSYVMKALNLKQRMGTMTQEEQQKYEKEWTPEPVEEIDSAENAAPKEEEETSEEGSQDSEEMIESIPIRSEDLNGSETLQEKISKGIRDLFGVKKTSEEISEEEESPEDIETEEMVQSNYSGAEFEEVPELEKEGEKPIITEITESEEETVTEEPAAEEAPVEENPEPKEVSQTMKMPELKIPESMKNIGQEEPAAEAPAEDSIFGEDFNLEDTILAAASAQGIEIPEESAAAESPAEPVSQPAEETEEISEQDLNEAEQEFFKGPSKKPEIPDLAEEDLMAAAEKEPQAQDLETEEFIADLLKDDVPTEEPEQEKEELSKQLSEEESEEPEEEIEPLSEEEQLEKFIDSIQPEAAIGQSELIEREPKLTDEEIKLFSYFVKVPGMEEQLIDTLCRVQQEASDPTSNTGNIIVMGGSETGKTRLISGLIPAICKELKLSASKVAYVFAEQINGKDIKKVAKKLAGGFFVIEKANQLDAETAEQLVQAMEQNTEGMIVILEDDKIGMRKLIARYPKLAKKFTSTINIPVFTNDELANFAKVYAMEQGYRIDNMGMLSLYNIIGSNQKSDQPMNIGSVKVIVDTAIAKTQGGIRKFRKSASRVDRDGFKILTEKDFNKANK